MIGIIIVSAWIIMGIVNMFLWREEVEEQSDEVSHVINDQAFKKFFFVLLIIFSPYYLFVYTRQSIINYFVVRSVKKKLKTMCDKSDNLDFEKTFGEVFRKKKK